MKLIVRTCSFLNLVAPSKLHHWSLNLRFTYFVAFPSHLCLVTSQAPNHFFCLYKQSTEFNKHRQNKIFFTLSLNCGKNKLNKFNFRKHANTQNRVIFKHKAANGESQYLIHSNNFIKNDNSENCWRHTNRAAELNADPMSIVITKWD